MSRDRGSATVLVSGVIGVVILLLIGALALISAATASTRARTAADLGALAGAERLVNGGRDDPCAVAETLVRANGGAVRRCEVVGSTVEVTATVTGTWPGLGPARARSRAGPASG